MLKIGTINDEIVGNNVRLNAIVEIDGIEKTLFFETSIENKEYICLNKADGFLVGLLVVAMQKGSVLKQTHKNLEIILVDDGSTDNSPVICDNYLLLDSRVQVIHKQNGGLSDARNYGLYAAKGDYIYFLDGDDYIENILIEKAIEEATKYNADMVVWGHYSDFVNENEELRYTIEHKIQSGVFDEKNYYNIPINYELIGIIGYAWNKLYLRSMLVDNNFKFQKGLSLIEDITFNAPVLSIAKKIVFLEEVLTHYLQRPRKTLGSQFYENFFELNMRACSSIENLLMNWGIENSVIEQTIACKKYNAIKATIIMLCSTKKISYEQKKSYLDSVLNDSDVQEKLNNVQINSLKDKMIYTLIKKKNSYFLLGVYSLIKS